MSYILDALRKADAERERGSVPGIHAQPSFGSAMAARVEPSRQPWLWLAVGAIASLFAAAAAWHWSGPASSDARTAPLAALPVAVSTAPVAATSTAPVAATPMPAPPTPGPRALPVTRAGRSAEPGAPRVDGPPPTNTELPPAAAAPTLSPTSPATTAAVAAPRPTAAGEKVYALAELPDDVRSQVPAVTVGGSMYSSKSADRILIINGLVLHEGEQIAPELVLQQIRLKSALLSFKGYRYTIVF